MLSAITLCLLLTLTHSVLPPGYEDKLFCPPTFCLGRKHPGKGFTGPKSFFWECRFGNGGDYPKNPRAPIPVTAWGPKLANAAEKFKEHQKKKYHSSICSVLHGKSADGTYTVVSHDTKENGYHDSFDLGEGSGLSYVSVLFGGGIILCFILFCFMSSILGASGQDDYRGEHDYRDTRNVEMTHEVVEESSTIDVDKFN